MKPDTKLVHAQVKDKICDICGFATADRNRLKKHQLAVHEKIKDKRCTFCDYKAAQLGSLQNHIKAIHEKIKDKNCRLCSYKTCFDGDLRKHVVAVHDKNKDKICKICGFATTDAQGLKRHVEAIHKKIKNKVCHLCKFSAYRMVDLKRHIKTIHDNVKEYTCKTCEYATNRMGHLNDHVKSVHDKIKDIICHICGFQTVSNAKVKKHISSMHNDNKKATRILSNTKKGTNVTPKDKICDFLGCGYATSRKSHLMQHIKAVHDKIRDYNCERCDFASSEASKLKNHNCKLCTFCDFATSRDTELKQHTMRVHHTLTPTVLEDNISNANEISPTGSDPENAIVSKLKNQDVAANLNECSNKIFIRLDCVKSYKSVDVNLNMDNTATDCQSLEKHSFSTQRSILNENKNKNNANNSCTKPSPSLLRDKLTEELDNIEDTEKNLCDLNETSIDQSTNPTLENTSSITCTYINTQYLSQENDALYLSIAYDDETNQLLSENSCATEILIPTSNQDSITEQLKVRSEVITETIPKKEKVCKICGYRTRWEGQLKTHIKAVHEKVKDNVCILCGFATSKAGNLKCHIKVVHNKIKNQICDVCGYKTDNSSKLKDHIKSVHEKIKDKICETCGREFSTIKLLRQHVRLVHEKITKEEICGFATNTNQNLQAHKFGKHGDKINNKICSFCNYSNNSSSHLRKHIKSVHENSKSINCSKCSFKATNIGNLQNNIKSIPEQLKDEKCDCCGKFNEHKKAVRTNINHKI